MLCRFTSLLLALLLLLSLPLLAACNKDVPPDGLPTDKDTGADTEEKEPLPTDKVYTVYNNETQYKIVYGAEGGGILSRRTRAENLAATVKKLTGVTVPVVTDEEAESDYEILVGNTNRKESKTVTDKIGAQDVYRIEVIGTKLVLNSTEPTRINFAIRELEYVAGINDKITAKKGELSFPLAFVRSITTPKVQNVSHIGYAYTSSTAIDNKVLQGGCTDGTYGYFALENQNGNYEDTSVHRTKLSKVRLSDGKVMALTEDFELDHSNDMCYYSKKHQVIVVHNGIQAQRISFFDADTLSYVKSVDLSIRIFSLAYDPVSDRFVAGISGGFNFAVLDGDLKVTKTYSGQDLGHVKQGGDCDERFIYFVQTGATSKDSNYGYIAIYTWSGDYLGTVTVPLPKSETAQMETECIFHSGDTFYIAYNKRHLASGNNRYGHIHKMELNWNP